MNTQNTDTSSTSYKISVMQAFERGEKVEWVTRGLANEATLWTETPTPTWNWSQFKFRIAEPVDPYKELKAAHARGETILWREADEIEWRTEMPHVYFDWSLPPSSYRIKPTPKLVPLEASDIPPVCWIDNGTGFQSLVLHVSTKDGVAVAADNTKGFRLIYWPQLMDEKFKYSTDRVTWKACSKEEK